MATTEEPSMPSQQRQPTKRERAFLGQLPDDFLRVEGDTPVSQQSRRGQSHLVPLTYAPQQGVYQDNTYLGRLRVTVAQAKLVKNYGLTRMDPYCRVRIGHAVYETPTDVNGSKNPRWNKSFSCNLPRGVNSLYIEIFNERYLSLDDRIAWGYFEFNEDVFNGETVEEWVPLTGKQGNEKEGNVNIILSLQSLPPSQSYQLTAFGNQPINMAPQTMPGAQVYYHGGYPPVYTGQQQQQQPSQPPQQPPQPRISEDDVKRLHEMFPTLDIEVVRSVLEANRGNTDEAVSNLLQMIAE